MKQLNNKGYDTSIVEMLDKVAIGESSTVLPLVIKDFKEHNVTQYVNTKVNNIKDNVIYATNTKDGTEITIQADTIINALGSKKNIFDETNIKVPLTYVGDCSGDKTADIASAIRSGYHAANAI
ncbi:MAG: FAD-dependent oxidoreductase [Erysipelotrichaceae bacterium]|nr:FAD-dependent oxidoreductase [Erysipelotrichaceae bacterium]